MAYKYAKGVYSKKDFECLKTNYAKEYIKMADVMIKEGEIKEAVLDINNSLKLKELPAAKYKLALLYRNSDIVKSEKLISKVLCINPYIVNPYIYNGLLNDLVEKARQEGNVGKINFYDKKIKAFNKLLTNIYIYKGDLKITGIKVYSKKEHIFSKDKIFIEFSLKNETKNDIAYLDIFVEIYYQNNKLKLEKKLSPKQMS